MAPRPARKPKPKAKATGLSRIAPPRFLLFLVLYLIGVPTGIALLGWPEGPMAGFDVAAIAFFASCAPLFNDETEEMRAAATRNDANRALLLAITALVTLIILAAVAAELSQKGGPPPVTLALVIGTLLLCWGFGTLVFAMHYAHMFYSPGEDGLDGGGIVFPGTKEPDYWDFLYFSATIGMTFQTSDTDIECRPIRRTATFHSLIAYIFNLGVVAFTINVIGGS